MTKRKKIDDELLPVKGVGSVVRRSPRRLPNNVSTIATAAIATTAVIVSSSILNTGSNNKKNETSYHNTVSAMKVTMPSTLKGNSIVTSNRLLSSSSIQESKSAFSHSLKMKNDTLIEPDSDDDDNNHVKNENQNAKPTTIPKKKQPKPKATTTTKLVNTEIKRTQSFQPMWHGEFDSDTNVKIHTLILGTHPSVQSLAKQKYYAHPMNTFWWIAGDCLGFRRDSGLSPSSGKYYQFTEHLKYDEDKIIPYSQQLELLTSKGFALWDLFESCEREGSLDSDIQNAKTNRIREFCDSHPTIRRIVLANGTTQATFFQKFFKDWCESGELRPARNDASVKSFKKFTKMTNNFQDAKIECVVALGVSPAAASYSYEQKRDFYKEHCYDPGLDDHQKLNDSQ